MDFKSISAELSALDAKKATTRSTVQNATDFPELYPALPAAAPAPAKGAWGSKPTIKPSKTTEIFKMEVADMEENKFGQKTRQQKLAAIVQKTNTEIEMVTQKDQSVNFVIHGKIADIAQAKKAIKSAFTVTKTVELRIPQEYHRFLLGKGGKDLTDLATRTDTKITVPKQSENSDVVLIVGARENCEQAAAALKEIADEKATQGSETVVVPKNMRQFVFGFNREGIQTIIAAAGGNVEVHVPPSSSESEEVVIKGHKTHVAVARDLILNRLKEQNEDMQSLNINNIPKEKHKWAIGPKGANLGAIYASTGVLVTMPPIDDPSYTITLRGKGMALSRAYQLLHDYANSHLMVEVRCPQWLRKYVIGAKGSSMQALHKEFPEVFIKFVEGSDVVTVEGPKDDVFAVQKRLTDTVLELERNTAFVEMDAPYELLRHIIGKGGQNLTRLHKEFEVSVDVPKEEGGKIRIEGPPAGVLSARRELEAMIHKLQDEVSLDVSVEQRFHKQIIGKSGENIKEIQDKYPEVQITFPKNSEKSDTVTVKGPKEQATACAAHIKQMGDKLTEENFTMNVVVFKDYHKHVIGKGGVNINKIREETSTKIDIPNPELGLDHIVVTGRKENVIAARDAILAIQAEMANIVTKEVKVLHHMHNVIIGSGGRLVKSISQECGNVNIHFPKEKSDIVTIRGPSEEVDKARHKLLELVTELEETSFAEEMDIPAALHKHIIGRNGANIKKVKDETGCRVVFPTKDEDATDTVLVIGRKEDVRKAKLLLADMVKEQEEIAKEVVEVDAAHVPLVRQSRMRFVHAIADGFSGTQLIFPKEEGNQFVLKGPKEQVGKAREHFLSMVANAATEVSEPVSIAMVHYGAVLGKGGSHVRAIQSQYNVHIKFPDRADRKKSGNDAAEDGNGEEKEVAEVMVSGQPADVAGAKAALLALVPVNRKLTVPLDCHRHIIGAGGRGIREIMDEFDVNVRFPPSKSASEEVIIHGPEANIARAVAKIESLVEKIQQDNKEREKRNFTLTLDVDSQFHAKIIGRAGATINSIRDDTGCRIELPKKSAQDPNKITVIGYEDACAMARDRIMEIVKDAEASGESDAASVSTVIKVDPSLHGRMIGARGKQVAKLSAELGVQIKFPRDKTSDEVTLRGPAEKVEAATDVLLDLAAEYLAAMEGEEGASYFDPVAHEAAAAKDKPRNNNNNNLKKQSHQQVVPEMTSAEAFPSMSSGQEAPAPAVRMNGAWGAR